MKKLLLSLISSLALFSFLVVPVSAHRSGCHSWHSCPSDSGSYICGDTGHCSACGDNQYCQNGDYSPAVVRRAPVVPVQTPAVPSVQAPIAPSKPVSTPTSILDSAPSVSAVTPAPLAVKPVVKAPAYFVGTPRSYAQLLSCRVVGNGASKIYHLRGSRWIKTMNLKSKTCFGTEAAAKARGYRKSKT